MKRSFSKKLLCLALAFACGFWVIAYLQKKSVPESVLHVYCAADLKNPGEIAAADFKKLVGTGVSYQFGGTAALLSQIQVSQTGDLLITADESSLEDARKLGVIREVIPLAKSKKDIASVAVLSTAKDPATALRFARFLASEHGNAIFNASGLTSITGDSWALEPEFVLYSGGVNRPAIERLLTVFSTREGVRITTVFNGCGILCASMKAVGESSTGAIPDAYYACDLCFIPPVAKQFPEVTLLTETRIGIVVQKGNPHGIKTPAELAKPGLRVGLCNAEQSTLGFMTAGILRDLKLETALRKNVSVEVPTADFLINQMRAGGIDAAIVYSVNAIPQAAHLEFLPIDHKGALAVQPFAIAAKSPRRQMGERLLAFLKENKAEFEKAGFVWRGELKPMKSSDIEIPEWLKPQ